MVITFENCKCFPAMKHSNILLCHGIYKMRKGILKQRELFVDVQTQIDVVRLLLKEKDCLEWVESLTVHNILWLYLVLFLLWGVQNNISQYCQVIIFLRRVIN